MQSTAKLATLVIVLAASTTALAQWPKYTPQGVPLGADGKPDMNGPVPRAADGKPDLSGVWEITRDPNAPARGNPAAAAGRGGAAGTPARGGAGGGSPFGNIGNSTPGGAPYLPWAADLVKKRMANNSKWWNGYSVGHWDGDTLVIETTGFMDDGWLDVRGSPLTSAGKITERFRRPRYGALELEETIDDPKTYTQPFTAKVYYRFSPDTQLIEFVCMDKDAQHYVGGPSAK